MSTPQGTGLVFISSALFPFLYGLKIHRIKNKYNFLKGGVGIGLAGFLAYLLILLALSGTARTQ